MKIISVTKKEFEEVITDDEFAPLYRRLESQHWEHWLGDNAGWMEYRFTDLLENAYDEWVRKERLIKEKING